MEKSKKLVRDLNSVITCRLCEGYLVDATTLGDCLHTFCHGCILRYFENNKTQCPVCPTVYKKKSACFRSDAQIQALVYKMVPSLYVKEMQRREDFYRSTGVRAGSSCSDDSVIDRERDMINETEEMISQCVGDKTKYLSPEDSISLSLEYYQAHLDTSDITGDKKPVKPEILATQNGHITTSIKSTSSPGDISRSDQNSESKATEEKNNGDKNVCDISQERQFNKAQRVCDKRYLQCPAGVNMKHLQKFVRMKYGLSGDHRVDIIYKGEVLPMDFSLMDVAYTFKWEKKKPMRFFYRIFTPMKIRPIKIVNTALSTGGKQLQIVPVTGTTNTSGSAEKTSANIVSRSQSQEERRVFNQTEETESEQQDKERLLANLQLQSKKMAVQTQNQNEAKRLLDKERLFVNLQLQSKSKALQSQQELKKNPVPEKIVKECVFEYEEPDQEEIKRFAEKRDREWALQKKLEEETRPEEDYIKEYHSKKRKKSKHSKTDSNGHKEKKRKLHAEITNNDKSDLKLKVKITTNGHKHKHHKIESNEKAELSHKEKLLQMRQVRHKHLSGSSGDEKSQPAIPTIRLPKIFGTKEGQNAFLNDNKKKKDSVDNNNVESQAKPRIEPMIIKPIPSGFDQGNSKPQRSEISAIVSRKDDKIDRSAQKTFLKTAQSFTDKYPKDQKVVQSKIDTVKAVGNLNAKVLPIGSISSNNKAFSRKIASLQQRCTIQPKNQVKPNPKKVVIASEKPKMMTPQYPPGFTVSKIETGVKRKADDSESLQDKRPSLEITLIPPSSGSPQKTSEVKSIVKRPPPGTIPLERIKNAVNLKSGISIIPKIPDRHDSIGVLDLSKPNKSPEVSPKSSLKPEPINGLSSVVNRQLSMVSRPAGSPAKGNSEVKTTVQLSNLQMLSKVATEHPTLNKMPQNAKLRPQLPNLQTINKIQSPNMIPKGTNMQRMPPKLNEIQKFRPVNPQIRNMRPNQNQNIRNIPNPSLLMNRQQPNQGRIGQVAQNTTVSSGVQTNGASEKKEASAKPQNGIAAKEVSTMKSAILEQKISEKKEISV